MWNSFSDVVEDGITGLGYELNNIEDLYIKLNELVLNTDRIMIMKRNCLEKAEEYSPEIIMKKFMDIINKKDRL